jgi:hypothetical protein
MFPTAPSFVQHACCLLGTFLSILRLICFLCLEWIFLYWGSLSKFHNQFLGRCGSTQVGGCTPVRTHTRFLGRNWWRGITALAERAQVTTHIRCVLGRSDGCRKVIATATAAFIPNVDVVISYRRVKYDPFVMSCNMAPAGQLWEKVSSLMWLLP